MWLVVMSVKSVGCTGKKEYASNVGPSSRLLRRAPLKTACARLNLRITARCMTQKARTSMVVVTTSLCSKRLVVDEAFKISSNSAIMF